MSVCEGVWLQLSRPKRLKKKSPKRSQSLMVRFGFSVGVLVWFDEEEVGG